VNKVYDIMCIIDFLKSQNLPNDIINQYFSASISKLENDIPTFKGLQFETGIKSVPVLSFIKNLN
jgi:hypothetical protein